MTVDEWAKELKKNTVVMKKTFEANELELLNFGFMVNGSTVHCLVEVSSVDEDTTVDDFEIKLNLYNTDGDICAVHDESAYDFTGYDTYDMWLGNFSELKDAVSKARLYVKKV